MLAALIPLGGYPALGITGARLAVAAIDAGTGAAVRAGTEDCGVA